MLSALRRLGNRAAAPAVLPAPQSPRELLLALRGYDKDKGLDEFLSRFDFSHVTPHQVYFSVLGRLPESARVAAMPPDYDPREQLKHMLLSSEFQGNLILHVLRAFPEKKRLFFVHVPKCAGSDLGSHLMQLYKGGYMGQLDQNPVNLLPSLLPWRLQIIVTEMQAQSTMAVVGHIGLNWLLNERLLRFGDTVFSVVRDPIDMAISKVNYTLTLLARDFSTRNPVILDWIERLQLGEHASSLPTDPAELKRLALLLLRDRKVTPDNNLCRFLGRGTAESALDLCASSNVELTTVTRYDAWLKARWGIGASRRVNESNKYLSRDDLGADDWAYLHELTREDQQLYARIDRALDQAAALSLPGSAL